MRILTFACSTILFLPFLSLAAWANTENQSQSNDLEFSAISEKEINQKSNTESEFNANNLWNNSNSQNEELKDVKFQLQDIRKRNFSPSRGVPALTIANPYGFGADRGFFTGLSYQVDTRGGLDGVNDGDATWGIGLGLGDAQKALGAELSYNLASFGQNGRDFGSGGFNLKLHRKLAEGWGVAAGWNSFLSIGDANDLDDSLYFATTKIFRTRQNVNSAFSRVGATIGVGNGQFRSVDSRVARPVSFVTEWTGQDLGMGLSISPFRTLPLTVNLGARDIVGAGDGARFIFGVGTGI